MDPFTIAASVLRITTSCIGVAKTLHDIHSAWNRAPETISTLSSQLKLTSASLMQIQSLLLRDTSNMTSRRDVVDAFDTALTACLVLSTWLEKYVQDITKGVLGETTTSSWKEKLRMLWNEAEVKEILEQLQAQQGAISLLINMLQMDSISEIKTLVRKHEALLEEIARNTSALRQDHAVEAPESIFSMEDASESVFSTLTSRDSSKGFESDVLKSKVYSKAFTNAIETSPDDCSDSLSDAPLEPVFVISPGRNIINILPKSGTDVTDLLEAAKYLGITKVIAKAVLSHRFDPDYDNPSSFKLLEFSEDQFIVVLAKLDQLRYLGQVIGSDGESSEQGIFYRSHVKFIFKLHTARSFRLRRDSQWQYSTPLARGDMVSINAIENWILWPAKVMNSASATINTELELLVYDLEIDSVTTRQFEILLRSFAFSSKESAKYTRAIPPSQVGEWETFFLIASCTTVNELEVFGRTLQELRKQHNEVLALHLFNYPMLRD